MPVLSAGEAVEATDAFLWSLYGDELYDKWLATKIDMNFTTERDFVSWLLQLAHSYMYPPATTTTVHPATYNAHTNIGFSRKRKNYSATTSQVDRVNNTVAVDEKQARFVSPHLKVESGVGGGAASLASRCEVRGEMREGDGDLLVEKSEGGGHLTSDEIILDSDGDDIAAREIEGDAGTVEDVEGDNGGAEDVEGQLYQGDALHRSLDFSRFELAAGDSSQIGLWHPVNNDKKGSTNTKPFHCSYCKFEARRKFTLLSHLISRHGAISRHICEVCHKGFPLPSALRRHKKRCAMAD